MTRKSDGLLARVVAMSEPDDAAKERILDGALQTFTEFGIKRTTMTEVAARSRISPATLYRKFVNRTGLVEAVGLREAQRILRRIDTVMEQQRAAGADMETQATELLVTTMGEMRDHKLFRRLVRTEPELVLPFFTTDGAAVLALGRDYLAAVIGRLQHDGQLPAYDPLPVAEVFARLALSFTLTRPTLVPLHDRDKARAFVREVLLPALGAPRGRD